jgi:hypothetical protein
MAHLLKLANSGSKFLYCLFIIDLRFFKFSWFENYRLELFSFILRVLSNLSQSFLILHLFVSFTRFDDHNLSAHFDFVNV